jgi:hypothetical protein
MNPRLVKVIPDVEDNVPREFGNFKTNDDGNAVETIKGVYSCIEQYHVPSDSHFFIEKLVTVVESLAG